MKGAEKLYGSAGETERSSERTNSEGDRPERLAAAELLMQMNGYSDEQLQGNATA